jgi:hypothetical protein
VWNAVQANPPYAPYAHNAPKRVGLAVASLVVGIVSFFTFGLLFAGAVIGIVLGVVALARISRQPAVYGGKGLAIGGIVTSVLSLVIAIPLGIIFAIAIPNLLASRRAANEASAIRSLRMISDAQAIYLKSFGWYGNLDDLTSMGLIEASLIDGENDGYRFTVRASGYDFEVVATPEVYRRTGTRSYFMAEDHWIHVADKGGLEANGNDPLIEY